jgi:hypothetical protein
MTAAYYDDVEFVGKTHGIRPVQGARIVVWSAWDGKKSG